MKIELFSFDNEKTNCSNAIPEQIFSALNQVNVKKPVLHTLDDFKSALSEIAESLKHSDVLILMSPLVTFFENKEIFFKAFRQTSTPNKKIESRIAASGSPLPEKYSQGSEIDTLFPSEATIFPTQSGSFSGFGICSGNQHVIFLPYEDTVTALLIRKQVIPFLLEDQEPKDKPDKPQGEASKESELVAKLYEKLKESNIKIAVANTPSVAYIKSCLGKIEGLIDYFTFVPYIKDRSENDPHEYVTNLACAAAELSGASYGIAFTDTYLELNDSKRERFVHIAVSNDTYAKVSKIYALENENKQAFLNNAAYELISLLKNVLDEDSGAVDSSSFSEEPEPKAFMSKFKTIITIAILLIALTLTAIMGKKFIENRNENQVVTTDVETTATETTDAETTVSENNEQEESEVETDNPDELQSELQDE